MDYFKNKKERTNKAIEHTAKMEELYRDDILACVQKSIVYGGPGVAPTRNGGKQIPRFFFLNTDSVSALLLSQSDKKAVLNFASYKTPGGMFLKGSSAQEESLCHESYLYNILREFEHEYYEWNRANLNRALYTNRAIYTPEVLFEREEKQTLCDVITCAAPNISTARRYQKVQPSENYAVLGNRIKFVRDIAEENEVETLIAGAFGCGVFGQDPDVVSGLFEEIFAQSSIKNVVFAVLGDKTDKNVVAFCNMVNRRKRN